MDLVEVDGGQSEPAEGGRSAASSERRTSSFHGDGMNLVATTARDARVGSSARSAPMIRSLSPPP